MEDMETETSTSLVGDSSNLLLSWGSGEFGQHGHGGIGVDVGPDTALVGRVQKFINPQRIKHVACGSSHTAIVTDDDEVLTWGNGNSGQLGCGNKSTHTDPQRLQLGEHDSTVAGISCGSRHTVVWLENGRCYSCGNNFYAQLGYDFRIKNYKENQVLKERLIAQLAASEHSYEVIPHLLRPIMHKKVIQVSCGEKFTMFLFDSGQVAGCGSNSFGQIGNGTRSEVVSPKPLDDPENITAIACGASHSMAVTASGELYVWGMGRPCGSRRDDVLTPHRKMTRQSNVVAVGGGSGHSLALTANGSVYSWGGGNDGQLGHGEDVQYLTHPKALPLDALPGRAAQVACGDSYSAAVLANGSLYMWGKSSHVICSDQPSSHKVYCPTAVALAGYSISRIICGSWHVAALTGQPEWKPCEEDSEGSESEEEEEDSDADGVFDIMEEEGLDERVESRMESVDNFWNITEEIAVPVEEGKDDAPTRSGPAPPFSPTRPPFRPAREGTKLTLEEFYAPTPLPTVRPKELRRASWTKRQDKEEVKEKEEIHDSSVEIASDLEQDSDVMESQDQSLDVKVETTIEETKPIPTPPSKNSRKSKDRIPPRPKILQISRARTMATIPKNASNRLNKPNVYDMTAMSGGGDAGGNPNRFVIDKHIAIQGGKGSGVKKDPTKVQAVSKVSFSAHGGHDLEDVTSKASNSMPIPKMTRAHTLYGQLTTSGKDGKGKGVLFSPPVVHAVVPNSQKMRTTRSSQKTPVRSSETRPSGTKASPQRPVFSSASSWRHRDDKLVLGEDKPSGKR